jgi:hypothetical protein
MAFEVESLVEERDARPETETAGVTKELVLGVSKSAVPLRVELERFGEVSPEEKTGCLEETVSSPKDLDGAGEARPLD